MLNYHTVVSTAVDLLERAVPDPRRGERQGHPSHIAQAIRLVQSAGTRPQHLTHALHGHWTHTL